MDELGGDLPAAGHRVLAAADVRPDGRQPKQGYAIVGRWRSSPRSVTLILTFELQATERFPTAVGVRRWRVWSSASASPTRGVRRRHDADLYGAVNSFHDSYTSLGGLITMFNMQLGEVAPGGVGSGLYGMLILAIITVFVAGLMVGRTPEYLGKKIDAARDQARATYFLITPLLVLTGPPSRWRCPTSAPACSTPGRTGFEVLYAFTSAANNNGSAFAGITVNTDWYNTALGVAMLLGRFLPIIFVLALADRSPARARRPTPVGTFLPTDRSSSACSSA